MSPDFFKGLGAASTFVSSASASVSFRTRVGTVRTSRLSFPPNRFHSSPPSFSSRTFSKPKFHAKSKSTSSWATPHFANTVKMSSIVGSAVGIGSAGLYAVVSNPAQMGAEPEDAKDKAHHLKGGKGFRNPWDSFKEMSIGKLFYEMGW
jgi:N-acyl-phosphatidylethanolamine-hydrolysing phospholipase D